MTYDSIKENQAYIQNIDNKTSILGKLGVIRQNDPISKLQTYEAIKIETEQLLTREKIIFTINSIITVGLIVTTFHVI